MTFLYQVFHIIVKRKKKGNKYQETRDDKISCYVWERMPVAFSHPWSCSPNSLQFLLTKTSWKLLLIRQFLTSYFLEHFSISTVPIFKHVLRQEKWRYFFDTFSTFLADFHTTFCYQKGCSSSTLSHSGAVLEASAWLNTQRSYDHSQRLLMRIPFIGGSKSHLNTWLVRVSAPPSSLANEMSAFRIEWDWLVPVWVQTQPIITRPGTWLLLLFNELG